jgi:hypothetical protein
VIESTGSRREKLCAVRAGDSLNVRESVGSDREKLCAVRSADSANVMLSVRRDNKRCRGGGVEARESLLRRVDQRPRPGQEQRHGLAP